MSDIRELFAIRHNPSGGFLPEHSGRGYTHTEPETFSVPRLFLSAGAAKRALTWWLKGITSVSRTTGQDTWMGPGEYDEVWHEEPRPERKAEDMEVIPVLLKT